MKVSSVDPVMDQPQPRTWRRRLVSAGVLMLLLTAFGSIYAAIAPSRSTSSAADNSAVAAGRALYLQGCSSCHGLDGQGVNGSGNEDQGPPLTGVGAAAADFQVSTGRMPLKYHYQEAERKRPEYNAQQTLDIAAYVATFGPGPAIPTSEQLAYADADVAYGGALFRTNCAQCHNFDGSGGALTYGKYAPSLKQATPTQIYEAMITGPENMPVFGDQEITPKQKDAIIKYITQVRTQSDPGGLSLGRVGPVPEGLVAWVGGIGVLVLSVLWIGSRS